MGMEVADGRKRLLLSEDRTPEGSGRGGGRNIPIWRRNSLTWTLRSASVKSNWETTFLVSFSRAAMVRGKEVGGTVGNGARFGFWQTGSGRET
jgi:hypothetical protein